MKLRFQWLETRYDTYQLVGEDLFVRVFRNERNSDGKPWSYSILWKGESHEDHDFGNHKPAMYLAEEALIGLRVHEELVEGAGVSAPLGVFQSDPSRIQEKA